ncbi:chromatin structure-remodeling complex subunit RSC7 [Coemansia sp. BCRC 34301]|nr:chromatin structure-remodeling complex subunit RSC7 [Coemansia sp. BCRC 34301]
MEPPKRKFQFTIGDGSELGAFADGSVILPFSDVDMNKVRTTFQRLIAQRAKRLRLPSSKIKTLQSAAANDPSLNSDEEESLGDQSDEIVESPDDDDSDDDDDGDDDGDDGGDDSTADARDEKKIDSNGYLLGGRSYICAVFRSPCRKNSEKLYILTTECCRYTGVESTRTFENNTPLRLYSLTARERQILADNLMLSGQRLRSRVTMVAARSAFKLFGAQLVLNGRHIVDDYCKANWRRRNKRTGIPPCIPGQVVANMEAYHEFRDNYALARPPKRFSLTKISYKLTKEQLERLEVDRSQHFRVVGSWVAHLAQIREWEAHRRKFVACAQKGQELPLLSKMAARPELPPMEPDRHSSDTNEYSENEKQ